VDRAITGSEITRPLCQPPMPSSSKETKKGGDIVRRRHVYVRMGVTMRRINKARGMLHFTGDIIKIGFLFFVFDS
jgi:hypothetical protein